MSYNKTEYIKRFGEEAWVKESKRRNQLKRERLKNNPDKKARHDKYHKEYNRRHKEEKAEYNKQYYLENKDIVDAHNKAWNALNKDMLKKRRKLQYETNKETILKESKIYRDNHKEHIKQVNKQWRENNQEYIKEKNTQYYNSKEGRSICRHNSYYMFDKQNGFDTSLTVSASWIYKNILNSSCIYCGETDWKKLGCDRINNTKGHTEDNIVCSCGKCNKERSDRMSVEDFKKAKRGV